MQGSGRQHALKAENAELSPARGEIGIGELATRIQRPYFDYTSSRDARDADSCVHAQIRLSGGAGDDAAGVPQVKDNLILITLLVKLGVAAAFAAALARSTTFKNLLLLPSIAAAARRWRCWR